MIAQNTVDAEEVRQVVVAYLQQGFTWRTQGYRCQTRMAQDVLVKAALERSSIEATCASLHEVVSGNTLREQLNRALRVEDLRQQEAEMNAALSAGLPLEVPRGGVQLALDTHDEPCYAKTAALLDYTCPGKAKAGTTHFLRLASVYLLWRDLRVTLALTYVLPTDTTVAVVERLLERVAALGFHHTLLFMDKGFCSGEVIRLLQKRRQKALIACPIRGKQGGTRALCKGKGSYSTDYTFSDGTTVRLVVVLTRVPDASGKPRRKWLLFVTLRLNWSPRQVYQRYRRRFGIEASYRILRQARATTHSRNVALRFFLLGLALLLQNIWMLIRWCIARLPARGPRRVDPTLLRFADFKRLLLYTIHRLYALVLAVPAFRPLQIVIH